MGLDSQELPCIGQVTSCKPMFLMSLHFSSSLNVLYFRENYSVLKVHTFQVTMENDEYMSPRSSEVHFNITNIDYEVRVKVDNTTSSSVTLSWDPVDGVEGYIVSHNCPENIYSSIRKVTTNTSELSIQGESFFPNSFALPP